jgi:hypothetical protein
LVIAKIVHPEQRVNQITSTTVYSTANIRDRTIDVILFFIILIIQFSRYYYLVANEFVGAAAWDSAQI